MTGLDDAMDRLREVHNRYFARYSALSEPVALGGEMTGWRVVPRKWAWRYWDALIVPPPRTVAGWRLSDPKAPTPQEAVRRACQEIAANLAERRLEAIKREQERGS